MIRFLLLCLLPFACLRAAPSAERCYLFAYFLVNGDDGLHLAWSDDGLRFEEIVPGKSFLKPAVGESRIMRDPCLFRAPDGRFHLVWTTDWAGKTIGYASSPDLLHWSAQKAIPVMAHEPKAQNCWAPELTWDPATREFVIFWSTTILGLFPETENSNRRPDRNHRIYSTRTRDFEHFTPTRLHYNGGFNVIDATIAANGDSWLMFVKNETFAPKTEKNIRMIRCATIDGPFSEPSPAITGAYWAEGPSALCRDGVWYVYFDKHMENKYGLVRSKDLKSWEDLSDQVSFPKDARHGTVLEVPRSLVDSLR
jgi:hypothetical protein